jgi:Na+/melibiose symporter-like transporter
VSAPKKKPGVLWMLFYGRPRRGFPWLLVGVLVTVLVLAALFAIPGGSDVSWAIAGVMFGLLLVAALVFAIVASLRPRKRR